MSIHFNNLRSVIFLICSGLFLTACPSGSDPVKKNNPPTDIALSKTSIAENNSVNAVVGSFTTTDPDGSDKHTYSLVTSDANFNINGSDLRAAKVLDFETKNSYVLRIKTDDGKGGTFEKDFTITVTDVAESANQSPTDIMLSKNSIAENNKVNDTIGLLTTADPNSSDRHTYTIVNGGADFNISGNSLRAAKVLDFETKSSYPIRIKTDDGKGGTFEKDFTITVTDVAESANQKPFNIILSKNSIAENNKVNDTIGLLTTADPNSGDRHIYTIISGGDNFNISGNSLRASRAFNFETKNSYAIRIKTDDGKGGTFKKDFTVNITDVDENVGKPRVIWKGTKITFTKSDGADPAVQANQDRITDKVWITRSNNAGGLYNAVSESSYAKGLSPKATRWAFGTTADDIASLKFLAFHDLSKPQSLVNKNLVLQLVEENIYIDIKITSWSKNKKGGFSYERSTK